jgi:deoxyribonuclease (pyrimidine dimer)
MTRINLVPVEQLTDQHLFAEFRECKMVPKSLARTLASKRRQARHLLSTQCTGSSLAATDAEIRYLATKLTLQAIPAAYCLGKGHVSFFYDKGNYLHERYLQIRRELSLRGIHYNQNSELDLDGTMTLPPFNGNYTATVEALALVRARIADRIALQPQWYRKTAY